MNTEAMPPIFVTEPDFEALERLLDSPAVRAMPGLEALQQELDRAQVVDPADMPADVITMNSTARFMDELSGAEHRLTLVYPRDAAGGPERVSILAPVGSALLGLAVGQSIEWQVPGGRQLRLKVLEIIHQPEADKRG